MAGPGQMRKIVAGLEADKKKQAAEIARLKAENADLREKLDECEKTIDEAVAASKPSGDCECGEDLADPDVDGLVGAECGPTDF